MQTFIYRPDDKPATTTSDRFYNNWELLYAEMIKTDGPKIIQFDNSLSPVIRLAGSLSKYDMSQTIFQGMSTTLAVQLELRGIVFDPPPVAIEKGLDLIQMGKGPSFILNNHYLWVRDGVQLVAKEGPLFHTPGGVMSGVHLQRLCNAMGFSTNAPFAVAEGGTLAIAAAYSVSLMNAFSGVGSAKVLLDLMVGSTYFADVEPNWGGQPIEPNLKDQASRHFFNDTVGIGQATVQGAIEQIAPKFFEQNTKPDLLDLPQKQFGFWKDTDTGDVYFIANVDGGEIWSLKMSSLP